jgi:glycosyltransferase involved in cell wall biosynthesis
MIKKLKPTTPISVIMPVYNTADFLDDSITSILTQTYSNFEFIIVDDASTDNSWKIIRSYARKDKRIRAYRNAINLGVSLTSNIAISKAKYQYIARMDSDDVSVPNRLRKQLSYLKSHPKTVIVGGQCTIIDDTNRIVGTKSFPTNFQDIYDMMFWAVPIQQGFMMINKSLLPKKFTWYSPTKTTAEEVNLFFRLLSFGEFANLPDNLYYYRQLIQVSQTKSKKNINYSSKPINPSVRFSNHLYCNSINLAQILIIATVPTGIIYTLVFLFE